jgi:hypothetical protein
VLLYITVEHNINQTSKCVFSQKVVLSASFYHHVSFLNIRHWSGLHTVNVHKSQIHCDHIFRTAMHVKDDSGIPFENKVKIGILLQNMYINSNVMAT